METGRVASLQQKLNATLKTAEGEDKSTRLKVETWMHRETTY